MFVKSPKFKVECECGWRITSAVTNHTAFKKMNIHQQQAHGVDIYGRPSSAGVVGNQPTDEEER